MLTTSFDVAPDRAYFRVRYVTRNESGDIQTTGSALCARYETEEDAEKIASALTHWHSTRRPSKRRRR